MRLFRMQWVGWFEGGLGKEGVVCGGSGEGVEM